MATALTEESLLKLVTDHQFIPGLKAFVQSLYPNKSKRPIGYSSENLKKLLSGLSANGITTVEDLRDKLGGVKESMEAVIKFYGETYPVKLLLDGLPNETPPEPTSTSTEITWEALREMVQDNNYFPVLRTHMETNGFEGGMGFFSEYDTDSMLVSPLREAGITTIEELKKRLHGYSLSSSDLDNLFEDKSSDYNFWGLFYPVKLLVDTITE